LRFTRGWSQEVLAELASTDKGGYVKQAAAGVLGLLMAPSAALAERKFLFLITSVLCGKIPPLLSLPVTIRNNGGKDLHDKENYYLICCIGDCGFRCL